MGFANPMFLWAIGLAAIPFWLHLSRRRKFKKLDIGTLRFLEEARRSRRRKARWEEILLMLLRVGATILLALLFARPTFAGKDPADTSAEKIIILLDASGSITSDMAGKVKSIAQKAIVEGGKTSEGVVTLARFSDRVETIDSLDEYERQAGAPTRLDVAMNWALDRFLESGSTASGKLVVVGHFANSSLPENPPRVWPSKIEVKLIPVLPKKAINAAVTKVTLRTPYQTEKMELEATLQVPAGSEATVILEVEGFVEERPVRAGSERILFEFRPNREVVRGWVSVKAESDLWPVDDRRPFAFQWAQRSRILLIDGAPGSTPFDGEAYFVKKALEASGAAHGLSPFDPEIVYGIESRDGLKNLDDYAVVALCGVAELSRSEVDHLKSYVEKGGGLFVILGQGWGPELYTNLIEAGLFPEGSNENGGKSERAISRWDKKHPALQSFGTVEGGDLRSLSWKDGYEIKADKNWKMVAELDGGRPILIGKDRILICPHPLNRDWSDLPREPIFVPLVKSLFSFLGKVELPPEPAGILVPGIGEKREPGWYILPDSPVQIVVPDASESVVSSAEMKEVAKSLGMPLESVGLSNDPMVDSAKAIAEEAFQPRPLELWPWIAMLLLVWFSAEGWFATARPVD